MLSSLLIITASFFADQSAWPGFLGAGASEIDPATIPLKWSPTENVEWDASLPGHGQSSPVIWGEKVFVTTVEGDNKETCHTLCLSLERRSSSVGPQARFDSSGSQQRVYQSSRPDAGCGQGSRLRVLRMR